MTVKELFGLVRFAAVRHGNAKVCVRGSMEVFEVTDVDFEGGMLNIVIDDEVTGDNDSRN